MSSASSGVGAREQSDKSLVALAASGSEDACAEFYDRYGNVAYSLALRIIGDARVAEVAVEEAFATLWRTSGDLLAERRAKASTCILTLVHRHALASRRSIDGAGRKPVEHALDQLPDDAREMLLLAYFDGLTASEVAARLHQPLDAVMATLHAGLNRFRNALGSGWNARRVGAAQPSSPEGTARFR